MLTSFRGNKKKSLEGYKTVGFKMTEKKYILVSMEDERAKKIANVIGNKTCKKIIELMSEKTDISEKNISDSLNIPINTTEYNLKKLLDAGLIEKTKNFFWSKKGKKIILYKFSNKSIVISPKGKISSKLGSVIPAVIIGGIGILFVKFLTSYFAKTYALSQDAMYTVGKSSEIQMQEFDFFSYIQSLSGWYWFAFGVILAILIITISNWRKL